MMAHKRSGGVWRLRLASAIGLCTFCWLFLYLDSLYNVHRAEKLLTDLREFPFSTARFTDVREFAISHGGAPDLEFPLVSYPTPEIPKQESGGDTQVPSLNRAPACTKSNCSFEVSIQPRVWGILGRRTPTWLLSLFALSGMRPWALYSRFTINDELLSESRISVVQFRRASLNSSDGPEVGLVPLGYRTLIKSDSEIGQTSDAFEVFKPHITGGPANLLYAHLTQPSQSRIHDALNINVACFALVSRSCKGFDELAPSVWTQFQTLHRQ